MEEKDPYVVCGCVCGATVEVLRSNFLAGYSRSCGCLQKDKTIEASTTHGRSKTKMYVAWKTMRRRCADPTHDKYARYGGRGIKVCDRWQLFENFLADMGERPAGMEIDRIDNNGNYEPGNCRWVPHKDNCNNR